MSDKKVVVYGASGYTGRLVCEFLREFQIPFIAAGRSQSRIEEAMAKVGGVAARHGARVALIGILPTLREEDLRSAAMTDRSLAMILDDSAGVTPAKPQVEAKSAEKKRGWFGRA